MNNERKIKHLKPDADKPKPPPNPLYEGFTQLIGGAAIVARQIEADKNFPVPSLVQRFLDEFGRKAV